jgi:cobalamin biosynthesis protein CbiD
MLLTADRLTYEYQDGTSALTNVSFALERGEFTALLGVNGAGKSTLSLLLNGILRPNSGKLFFDGTPLKYDRKNRLEHCRRVGIVFQDPDDQLFSADVYRDVSFGAVNLGLPPDEVAKRVENALKLTGISDLRAKPTHALSHGQKKRAAIAGVLVMQPQLLILDEPTAGLDPFGVAEIMALLKNLCAELNVTILMATHDIDLVPLYCRRVLLLQSGRLLFDGKTRDLLLNPKLLRENGLRLPRIAHLMEILNAKDGLEVDPAAATISSARGAINKLVKISVPAPAENSQFIIKGGKSLKRGWTTGSCAAAASKAAATLLLTGIAPTTVSLMTPAGIELLLRVEYSGLTPNSAFAAVRKDGGDDPDVTTGLLIAAEVFRGEHFSVDGGEGVGRVTRPGLSVAVGESAINPVPRQMILSALRDVYDEHAISGETRALRAVISVPGGGETAKRTFNPNLGVVGGISILGTSGIVEPMSEQAIIDTIKLELDSRFAQTDNPISKELIITPGNYGKDYAKLVAKSLGLDASRLIKCSNFVGETLDYALFKGFKNILLIGHIGKLIKLAAGIFNTHSKTADGRAEIITAHAALNGANPELLNALMNSTTTDEAVQLLKASNLNEQVMQSLASAVETRLTRRITAAGEKNVKLTFILFSNEHGELIHTSIYIP